MAAAAAALPATPQELAATHVHKRSNNNLIVDCVLAVLKAADACRDTGVVIGQWEQQHHHNDHRRPDTMHAPSHPPTPTHPTHPRRCR